MSNLRIFPNILFTSYPIQALRICKRVALARQATCCDGLRLWFFASKKRAAVRGFTSPKGGSIPLFLDIRLQC